MDKNIVITIARQYGSGGRTIAQMLSERLGIHYYDKELLRLASEDSGINEDLFRNADEKIKNTKLFKIAHSVYHGELIPPESEDFTSMENLFNYQEKYVQKVDKRKADYHRYYTGLEWTDARNYDLCLDSSKLGFERCVDEIIAYMNVRFQD